MRQILSVNDKYHRLPPLDPAFVEAAEDFVLLETGSFGPDETHSYLFRDPSEVLSTSDYAEVPELLRRVDEMSRDHYLAGFCSYELGYFFEEKLRYTGPMKDPLIWFGVYDRALVFDHRADTFDAPHEGVFMEEGQGGALPEYAVQGPRLDISREEYVRRVQDIKGLIEAGDIYQANFTSRFKFGFSGSAIALYEDLKRKQRVSYNAFISAGELYVLSISPEMFFRRTPGRIVTRPMKGTAPRGLNTEEDAKAARWLHGDAKNRSENVMIVDLLRNDLGRVARTGSVCVEELFTVEHYETLLQMTSTVSAELQDEPSFSALMQCVFPSGSVTGAPKIRSMEVIRTLEDGPRGVYTGAVGFISPSSAAVFNIPIRTVTLRGEQGEMGVGSGIVYDSDPGDEFKECLLKADFLVREPPRFSLVETMRLVHGRISRIDGHLERLADSARYFNFPCDPKYLRGWLEDSIKKFSGDHPLKIRMLMDRDGKLSIEAGEFRPEQDGPLKVALSGRHTNRGDVFLYHKSTNRGMYAHEFKKYSAMGFADVLFTNEEGEVTEGAISNIFIKQGRSYFTPPVRCGLLSGVFRREFLRDNKDCIEKVLSLDDLRNADEIYITNSVRGMRRVALLPMADNH